MDSGQRAFCPWCGGRVTPTAVFCGSCGRPFRPAPAPTAPTPPPAPPALAAPPTPPAHSAPPPSQAQSPTPARPRRSGTPLLLVGGVVAIVGVVLVAAVVLGPGLGSNPGPGSSRTPGVSAAAEPPTSAPGSGAPVAMGERTPSPEDDTLGDPGDVPVDLPPPEAGEVPPFEQTPAVAGTLAVGEPGPAGSTTIGSAGGTVAAEGLTIAVPAGAVDADTTFTVSAARITGLGSAGDYGGAITPITPLYVVSMGESDLLTPATVTLAMAIPAGLPPDTVPMAFYYDEATGTLSPLTPVGADGTSLTVLAPHFSGILGALVDLPRLPATADSGFRPGVDDWAFANNGSYVALGGHCEGQTLSEIWYYIHQRRAAGASPLYGLYDNNGAVEKTPTLWVDDSDGYRFVSSVHAGPVVDRFSYLFLRNLMWNAADDRMTVAAFRAAIALSGQPQMIRITPNVAEGGHTMVLYRVTPTRLYVADPNYPGRLRSIVYDAATGKLGSYSSGDSATSIAAQGATSYTHFAYVPWMASKTEAQVAARWAEFEASEAGDRTFPVYGLKAVGGKDAAGKDVWVPLANGFSTPEAQLGIQVTKLGDNAPTMMRVYRGTSSTPVGPWAWKQTLELAPGDNEIGLLVVGKKGDAWGYVDFVRLTITRSGATVYIDELPDACPLVGTTYTFTATAGGIPPTVKRVGFSWDFGAGAVPGETYSAPFGGSLVSLATQAFDNEGPIAATVIVSDVGGASPVELTRAEVRLEAYRENSVDWTLCNHVVEP